MPQILVNSQFKKKSEFPQIFLPLGIAISSKTIIYTISVIFSISFDRGGGKGGNTKSCTKWNVSYHPNTTQGKVCARGKYPVMMWYKPFTSKDHLFYAI